MSMDNFPDCLNTQDVWIDLVWDWMIFGVFYMIDILKTSMEVLGQSQTCFP